MAHARLGPSNHRWPNCPGSVREEERYPDTSGAAAIDGTGSHLLLELCLENDVPAQHYDQQIIGVNHPDNPGGWFVDIDRCNRVQMCLNYIDRRKAELREQFPSCAVIVEAESKSDPGGAFGRTDWWGTVDITITVKTVAGVVFVEVVDYKDGRGWVTEKNNSQLQSYLFGKIRPYICSGPDLVRPFRPGRINCRMTIVQPKTNPVIRYQDVSDTELVPQVERLSDAAYATDDDDAGLVSGKHCQWCKANPKRGGHCTAATEQSLEVIQMNTEVIPAAEGGSLFEQMGQLTADPKTLTVEQLSQLASAKDALVAAFEKIEAEITCRIETGEQVPGFAMMPGRSTRVWNEDEETIVKMLKGRRLKQADIYPPKLISPAQVEKLESLNDKQKSKIMDEFVSVKAGKMTLKKVAHDHVQNVEKVVGQSPTTDVKSLDDMLKDVPTNDEPISFM